MNVKDLIKNIKQNGYEIKTAPVEEMFGAYAMVEHETHELFIDYDTPKRMKFQILAHEFIHIIDPECKDEDGTNYEDEHVRQRELVAEYGAKLIVGDNYIDDGFINNLTHDPLELLDTIDEAEKLTEMFI